MQDTITQIREASGATVALGILMVFLGMIAWMSPLFSGLTIAIMIGMLMITGGIVGTIYSFRAASFKEGVWKFLFGGLALLAGIIVILFPGRGLGLLTVILTVFFIVEGISKIITALKKKSEKGWGWVLFSGILSLIFAIIIIAQWPVSGTWAVGITVGAYLLVFGLTMIAFGSGTLETVKEIQDNRITLLKARCNALSEGVQSNQADIAKILILLNEIISKLGEKVSESEIDPTLIELNSELKETRKSIQEAYEMSKQVGEDVQEKVADLWSKSKDQLDIIRKKIDEATKNIKL